MKTENTSEKCEKSLSSRTVKAAQRFLIHKGYKILEADEKITPCQIVAFDVEENTIVFIYTDYIEFDDDDDFDDLELDLKHVDFEKQAIRWLSKNDDYIDVDVCFATVIAHIIESNRAIIRLHRNIF